MSEPAQEGKPTRMSDGARIVAELDQHQDAFVRRLVPKLRTLLPGYLPVGPDGYDLLDLYCRRNLADALGWLGRERPPGPDELEQRRADFARGARTGVAVTDVLRALRVGFQEIWLDLAAVAADLGPDASNDLRVLTERLWAGYELLATVATEAHTTAAREHDLAHQRELLDLWSSLSRLPSSLPAAEAAARRLGLDPDATYLAWAHGYGTARRPLGPPEAWSVHLRDVVVAFCAAPSRSATERRVGELRALHDGPVGVGRPGCGLAGLAQAGSDARRALTVAQRRGLEVATFDDSWLAALALDDSLGLGPLLEPAVRALAADPALAGALEVFLRLGGRLRPAARELEVHPNTLAYRLRRFTAATGADPSTLAGSIVTAFALVRAGGWSPEADNLEH